MVKDGTYIVIQSWMVNDMNLKGNELLVYAIIYGFTQDGETMFTGSLQYLADWTNSTKQGVSKNLKSLLDKGYIGKREKFINKVKFVEYYATQFNGVLNKVEQGIKQSLMGGVKQSLTNNIDIDKKEDNINKKKSATAAELVYDYRLSEMVRQKMLEFFEYRKEIKKPLKSERSIRSLLKQVETQEQAHGEFAVIDVIDRSIQNGWQGLFFDRIQQGRPQQNRRAEELDSFYRMADDWAHEQNP
jgi:hypothetical protein